MNSELENQIIFDIGDLKSQIYDLMLRIAVLEKKGTYFITGSQRNQRNDLGCQR